MTDEQEANPRPGSGRRSGAEAIGAMVARAMAGRALEASYAVLSFALCAWAMIQPTLLRGCVAGGFCLFALLASCLRAWIER